MSTATYTVSAKLPNGIRGQPRSLVLLPGCAANGIGEVSVRGAFVLRAGDALDEPVLTSRVITRVSRQRGIGAMKGTGAVTGTFDLQLMVSR